MWFCHLLCLYVTVSCIGKKYYWLQCIVCSSAVGAKKNTVDRHLLCGKHVNAANKNARALRSTQKCRQRLAEYLKRTNVTGGGVEMHSQMLRVKTVKLFLSTGTPLARTDHFREILENNPEHASLVSASSLRMQFVPFVDEEVHQDNLEACAGQYLCVIFDGTSDQDEVFNIVFRWCDEELIIHQRLVH